MNEVTKKRDYSSIIIWLLIAIYAIAIFAFARSPLMGTNILEVVGVVLLLLHGAKRYGWKGILAFIIITYIISTASEDLSIHTGFPFGHYYYTTSGGLPWWIDRVPVTVAPMYIAIGYISWTIGTVILDHMDLHLDNKVNRFLLPMLSAFVMVQFDLVQDPSTSTYAGIWIWQHAGGFFGVPLVNFLGWYLTCYVFMQIFALFLAKNNQLIKRTANLNDKKYWLQPIVVYGLVALSYVAQFLININNHKVLTDRVGHTWTVSNLYETAVLVMLFTMFYTVVLAFIRLFKQSKTIFD